MIVTFVDPTSDIGAGLLDWLVETQPDIRRRLFHTGTDEHVFIEVAGEASVVAPLDDPDELDGSTIVVIGANPAATHRARLLRWLEGHPEVTVLDLSPAFLVGRTEIGIRRVVPGAAPMRWIRPPDPALQGPLRLLGALGPLSPQEAFITLLCPVSDHGEDGVVELVAQAVARLSGARPTKGEALGRVLAFDAVPDGARSARAIADMAVLLPDVRVRIHAVATGLFHGHGASVDVRCAGKATEKAVRALLHGSSDVRVARKDAPATPAEVVDRDEVVCSHLAVAQEWVSAWLAYDGQRLGGLPVATALLSGLLSATAATTQ
jgi:hypothetical protein